MERQRDSLVPIGEAISGPGDPVEAIHSASPQASHHFTQADQVNQLVGASEASPDLGFMARLLALCSLPRSNPGNRLQYKRVNGPYTLIMYSSGEYRLPFGNLPRLLLAWVCTEAVRTQSRELVLGRSLSKFMRALGIKSDSGGARGEYARLRNQMKRLFGCSVSLIYKDEHGEAAVNSLIARRTEFWWNERKPNQPVLWESKIELGEDLFNEIIRNPVPAGHEHPRGPQTFFAGPRSLPMVGLPHLRPPRSATDHLATPVPSVRRGPDAGERQEYRERLSHKVPPRVKEDQDRLAGVELRHGQGRADPSALGARYPAFGSSSASKLERHARLWRALALPRMVIQSLRSAENRSWGFLRQLSPLDLSTTSGESGQFSTLLRVHSPSRFSAVTGTLPSRFSAVTGTPYK